MTVTKEIKLPSGSTVTRYALCSSRAIADGSHAQMAYFVEDAKKDIAYLAALSRSAEAGKPVVKGLDDSALVKLIYKHLPPKVADDLTIDKHPPMFPQAEYSVPTLSARNFVDALLSALSTPADIEPVATGWQPIETAPKDGTVVDLWHEEFGRHADLYWGLPHHDCGEAGRYCDSDWHDTQEGWVDSSFNQATFIEEFSHWMFPPSAPGISALSTPADSEPVAWPIATDDQVEALARECGWDNRKYMTQKDYSIWCERMRTFARLAVPSPPDWAIEQIDRLTKALEPFSTLQIPKKAQYNAGAYSIRHSDIEAARAALSSTKSGEVER